MEQGENTVRVGKACCRCGNMVWGRIPCGEACPRLRCEVCGTWTAVTLKFRRAERAGRPRWGI